jgi:hypothetical protein
MPKPGALARYRALVAEYGAIAIVVYLVIFAVVLGGFAFAIARGADVEGVAGGAGTLGAAWLATKVTQPLRIGATALLTPLVAALLRRRGRHARG